LKEKKHIFSSSTNFFSSMIHWIFFVTPAIKTVQEPK